MNFSQLALPAELLANLNELSYHAMTDIQQQSLPAILAGRDVLAQAKTGSGKTAAFALGLLPMINRRSFKVQALVLCPTRELAEQVAKEIRKLGRTLSNTKVLSLCGGKPFGPQLGSLQHGAHIIVGTPGRVLAHIRKGSLSLATLRALVLDEADRMLAMGFQEDMMQIMQACPTRRQTCLFSATYPDDIMSLSSVYQSDPLHIRVENQNTFPDIKQQWFAVESAKKLSLLTQLFYTYQPQQTIVFCHTKKLCQELAEDLRAEGMSAGALHGDLEQRQRDQVLVQFSNQSLRILVATDVAARGIDINGLDAVINFELCRDPEVHIHRIGRTGRAGAKGKAFNFCSHSERYKFEAIESYQAQVLGSAAVEFEAPDTVDQLLKPVVATDIQAPMMSLQIDGGRKQKLRPADILGALTAKNINLQPLQGGEVGKIDIFDMCAYVAVNRGTEKRALDIINRCQMKGRQFRARLCQV